MSEQFEAKLETGRTTAIVVQLSEYKGQTGLDVRKFFNGGPTKKGAFLNVEKGHAEFVVQALPKVLGGGDEQVLQDGSENIVVKRFDYKGMEGYSIRKENAQRTWGKGIWFKPDQGTWIAEQMANALQAD